MKSSGRSGPRSKGPQPSQDTTQETGAKGKLTRFQKFVVERWPRARVQNAPYNPRVIDEYAKKKLRENLRKVGLLDTVTVNRRTGNLVAGHQRLAALDALENNGEYLLDVAVVDLDPATERAQNVFMNNPSAQGSWDVDALGALLQSDGVTVEATGFDPMDLQMIFADNPEFSSLFSSDSAPAAAQKATRDLEEIAAMKQRRKEFKNEYTEEGDSEVFAVVIFNSRAERDLFAAACPHVEGGRYVDGRALAEKMGVDLSPAQAATDADESDEGGEGD